MWKPKPKEPRVPKSSKQKRLEKVDERRPYMKIVGARIVQTVAVSPAFLEDAIDRCNAFFSGKFRFRILWDSGRSSGGVLDCVMRNNTTVRKPMSLRVRLQFDNWHPETSKLLPKPTSFLATSPLVSWHVPSRLPCHQLYFESDAGVKRWTVPQRREVTAALCAALNWVPSGGAQYRAIARLSKSMAPSLRYNGTNRPPLQSCNPRRSLEVNPLTALFSL